MADTSKSKASPTAVGYVGILIDHGSTTCFLPSSIAGGKEVREWYAAARLSASGKSKVKRGGAARGLPLSGRGVRPRLTSRGPKTSRRALAR